MRRTRPWTHWIVAAALAVCVTQPASVHGASPDDTATAQTLFDQGKTLMGEKNYAEACPKLEESQRLDPGLGTLFQLAVCYEGLGKTASAWAKFKDVAAQARAAGQADRAVHADQRAAVLEPKLLRLVIEVPEGSQVAGLSVRRGSAEVGRAVWGTPIPVDPGELHISASAPGHAEWQTTLQISAKEPVTRVSVPKLDAQAEPAPAPVAPAPKPAVTIAPNPRPETKSGAGALPWIAFGIGGAGILVGAGSGLLALDKKSTLDSSCPSGKCPPDAHDDHAAFNRWRTISTVSFVVGAVGLGTGTVLLLTSGGKRERVEARVGPGSVAVGGRF